MPRGKRAGSKTPTADYDAGCPVRSTSTKSRMRKSRTLSSPPISRPENAWASRHLSRRILQELGKNVQIRFAYPVALGSRIQGAHQIGPYGLRGCVRPGCLRDRSARLEPGSVPGSDADADQRYSALASMAPNDVYGIDAEQEKLAQYNRTRDPLSHAAVQFRKAGRTSSAAWWTQLQSSSRC